MYTFNPTTFTLDGLEDSLFALSVRKVEYAAFANRLTFAQKQEIAQINDRITAIELELKKRKNESTNQ